MAARIENPFENEQPKIVHLEKSESHYEYCRMQMHEIEHTHRRTFIANFAICIIVCILAVFHYYVGGFGILSKQYAVAGNSERLSRIAQGGAFLAGGIFQILFGMIIIVLGYLAWANFHSLNIILETWYVVIGVFGIFKGDYISGIIGAVGAVFYFFSLRAMGREQSLSEMDGYPDFQEKFDISQSDIVIQTLLAHKGEHRTKSTLFTTDYSLRRKKKKKNDLTQEEPADAGKALAEELQKRLDEKRRAEQPAEAPAETEPAAELTSAEPEAETASEPQKEADAILAEAQAKAQQILAEAEAKARALSSNAAQEQPAPQSASGSRPQKKKKKTQK